MDLQLTETRALVGGASRGLGAAIAGSLVAEGGRVALAARPSADLDATAARLGQVAVAGDLATADGVRDVVAGAVGALGGLDLLVVNSGGPPVGAFDQLGDGDWEAAIAGTFMASIRLIREALPHLRGGAAPAILVILSSSVREPIPGLITSNALRPGLSGLIKTLVEEIAPIRINGIAPGKIATGRVANNDLARAQRIALPVEEVRRQAVARIPIGRYGEPAEVGRVAAFLLSPAASYVNGSILAVDGGMIRSLP